MKTTKKVLSIIIIILSISQITFSQSQKIVSWKDHKTLLYTGAGLYKVFPLKESQQSETSFILSGTLTIRPNKFIYLNTGIDLYKPEFSRKIVISLNFIPSLGFEEDNVMICIGAGGGLFAGEGGMGLRFMTELKAGYFFSKKYAASIEIKSPIYYDYAAEFMFTAGIMFAL